MPDSLKLSMDGLTHSKSNQVLPSNSSFQFTDIVNDQTNRRKSAKSEARDQFDWSRLTRRIASGDLESFEQYYESFFDLMFVDARRLTGFDEASCMDIVQDAMIKAIKGLRPMRDKSHVTAWTRVVLRNAAFDALRKRAKRMEQQLPNTVAGEVESGDLFDLQSRIEWVEQQLRNIEPELRHMVALRYRLGWTLQEVASKFGLKTGAVDGRIRRAVEKLRQQADLEFNE